MRKVVIGLSIEKEDNIVWISQILFRGKRKIPWEEVEEYLKQYVGKVYEISKTKDKIHIKADFPDEFSNSMDTVRLNGTAAKAKANAVQKVPELIRKAENKRFQENKKMKHTVDAQRGWYRYTTNFALPVYNEDGKILRYNVFRIELLVRCSGDGKLYLYDMVNIKKRNEQPA
ncbi:hypothetical protein HFM87_07865 [Blautia producta]|nr:hypothetical protein [Bacillota bacterium]NSG12293.1 hypothetical protein [Blautia producta]NSG15797.1 hypothetical protein [Blautia producta]NSJ75992.1 hypothetical protein [Blautia producta]